MATSEINDGIILAARVFLAMLFLIFGWRKLRDATPGRSGRWRGIGFMPVPVMAAGNRRYSWSLPVAFAVAVLAQLLHTSFGFCYFFFYTLWNVTYRASLLEENSGEATDLQVCGRVLQEPRVLWEGSRCYLLLVRDDILSIHHSASAQDDTF